MEGAISMATVQERVVDIVFEQFEEPSLHKSEITREMSFVEDLGADSLDVKELMMELEEEFSEGELSLDIPDKDADKLLKVGDLIDYIEAWLIKSQGGIPVA